MTAFADRRKQTLLIIDDDELFCDAIKDFLSPNMKVIVAHTGADGIAACSREKIDIILLDQNLPDAEGYTLCPDILQHNDQAKIIFITAHPSFEGAVKALRSGAHDYLSKPFELEQLSLAVNQAFRTIELEKVAQIGDYKTAKESEDVSLVGRAPVMTEVRSLIEHAAASDAPVLITGETGTGKNVAARAIHFMSSARREAFISVNCSALPENLIEAELFGYEKGAFTGATGSRKGVFEMAEDGTLLLDEIGEMPLHLQSKLLSVLEEKKVKRLGADSIRPVNVRVIAATGKYLETALGQSFRSDLYYRLSVLRIHLPPLREHLSDIPEICSHLLRNISGNPHADIDDADMKKLMAYDWPGNVRELKNILERAVILQKVPVLKPSEFLPKKAVPSGAEAPYPENNSTLSLEEVEIKHIRYVLSRFSNNYTQSAKALGISLSTLKRKLDGYSLK